MLLLGFSVFNVGEADPRFEKELEVVIGKIMNRDEIVEDTISSPWLCLMSIILVIASMRLLRLNRRRFETVGKLSTEHGSIHYLRPAIVLPLLYLKGIDYLLKSRRNSAENFCASHNVSIIEKLF